jgi:hypothetical protein
MSINTYYTKPLTNILSFLTVEEQQVMRNVCKFWRNAEKPPSIPVVENGYGDFLLFDTTGKEVNRDTFEMTYSLVFNKYLPQMHQKPVENRLKEVNLRLKEIDPALKAGFVPRAVYELYYILATAQEEVDLTSKQFLGCNNNTTQVLCWHNFAYNPYWSKVEKLPSQAVELAYRLNQFILREGEIPVSGLTETQFRRIGKGIHERIIQVHEKYKKISKDTPKRSPYVRGDLQKKVGNRARLILQLLNKKIFLDPSFLEKAISLECSEEARNAFVLYRGSTRSDEPLFVKLQDERTYPYCLSYGLSLFAGYHHDPKACASVRMFYDVPGVYDRPVLSYAIIIPFKNNWEDAYSIPKTNTLCALNAYGERFHARAKCINPENSAYIHGYIGENIDEETVEELISTLSEQDLRQKQDLYQRKRIVFMQK